MCGLAATTPLLSFAFAIGVGHWRRARGRASAAPNPVGASRPPNGSEQRAERRRGTEGLRRARRVRAVPAIALYRERAEREADHEAQGEHRRLLSAARVRATSLSLRPYAL